ncbi:MAG: hypothetical protein DRJ31_07205, partial [Candidatus Methanomethylicota archaeon]
MSSSPLKNLKLMMLDEMLISHFHLKPWILKLNSILRRRISHPLLELIYRIHEESQVDIITGFPVIREGRAYPDIDGLSGSIVLAEVLEQVVRDVRILTEPYSLNVLKELLPYTSLNDKSLLKGLTSTSSLSLEERDVAIFVEKPGANALGIYHNAYGENISNYCFHVEKILDNYGLTASIGDLGNEVGFGLINKAVKRHVKFGATCRCSCKAGIASSSKVDYPIISTTSNLGCYVLAACFSTINNVKFVHDPLREEVFIKRAVGLGAIDALSS